MVALSDFIAGLLIVFGATMYSVKYSFMIYFHVFLSWNDKPKLFFRSRIRITASSEGFAILFLLCAEFA